MPDFAPGATVPSGKSTERLLSTGLFLLSVVPAAAHAGVPWICLAARSPLSAAPSMLEAHV